MGSQPEDFGYQAPAGSVPVGAVDAPPGSKLYDMMQQHGAMRQRRPQARQAQRSAAAMQREQQRRADVFGSLMAKAVPGMERPGEGMVPFGQLPKEVRAMASQVYGNKPIVGFDPNQLDPQERLLLGQLVNMGQSEFAQQNPDAINPDTAAAPGMPGAPNIRGRR